jgi:hypothetical protein
LNILLPSCVSPSKVVPLLLVLVANQKRLTSRAAMSS